MPTYSEHVTSWFLNLGLEDLPDDVVEATKFRILDTLGVMLVAADTPIGRTVRDAVMAMGAGSDSRMIGYGDRTTAMGAALVNGTLAHAMDFDDTHNASLVYPGLPPCPKAAPGCSTPSSRTLLATEKAASIRSNVSDLEALDTVVDLVDCCIA